MAEQQGLSEMMSRYLKTKEQYKDCILFYRLGDFYEMFFDDALCASRELDITLTGRSCGLSERAPMCGVPFHSADSYIAKLVQKGYKVAICEQVEDPKEAKGIVKREVVRIVTPGTILDANVLDSRPCNYMFCIVKKGDITALSIADVSTGELLTTSFENDTNCDSLISEIDRFSPVEVLLNQEAYHTKPLIRHLKDRTHALTFTCDEDWFLYDTAKITLTKAFSEKANDVLKDENQAVAVAAIITYLLQTQKVPLLHFKEITKYNTKQYLELDGVAQRNLELVETMRDKSRKGSLLWVLDKTCTTMGARILRRFLMQPLLDVQKIKLRQDSVLKLTENMVGRDSLRATLKNIRDLERLISRIAMRIASPKDLISLKESASYLPELKNIMSGFDCDLLSRQHDDIDILDDIYALIDSAIVEKDTPVSVRDGKFIKEGYDEQIDYLNKLVKNSQQILREIEEREREATGITKLKVSYNKVFGYYIEVTNSNLSMVPDHYIRKQTLTNAERFITEELKNVEKDVLSAKDKVIRLEYEAYQKLIDTLILHIDRIQKTSHAIGLVDCLASLAEVAVKNRYCMPVCDYSDKIDITEGRHPVVEQVLRDTFFVPNDTCLDCDDNRTYIITGPNMAGKSTYMRQVALITLMAQIGSFVPATSARIGVVDKIFTRVGASDDLAAGHSTYMVEMKEVADILNSATKKSLIILDEIGRGTSTYDGLSIAWSIIEYCTNKIGAKTLFATHYHELTELEDKMTGIKNYCVIVKKRGDDITFLRKIARGGADESYGIEVAKLAGVKDAVITRAKQILSEIEKGEGVTLKEGKGAKAKVVYDEQLSLEDTVAQSLLDKIKALDVTTISPIEAINILYELKNQTGELS